jgi:hypothetical protein
VLAVPEHETAIAIPLRLIEAPLADRQLGDRLRLIGSRFSGIGNIPE